MMDWYTMAKEKVDLVEAIMPLITNKNVLIHVGTDAQARGKAQMVDFVTVVCIHTIDDDNVGHGGRVFYWKDKNIRTSSLWEKLYGETWRSLQIAVELSEEFGDSVQDRILVHVDANPNPIYKSSSYVKQLAGMVMGYGFRHILKPDAWAASHAADHIVKGKN
jgi:predicted RNase H-related nuclease YkuK (DUF458 family)